MTSRYAALSRDQLATLVPELLLIGQLIDRSGMAWCIRNFGRKEMLQIAIEEWMAASPIYTKRMQKALRYEGDDVITIFKGLQLDIGAPPQFMDFRYTVHHRWHGEFRLDHCGALLDVEPMGEDYVRGICHDIEDPTFDATAAATNRRAQIRPIHRRPRVPADRHPHCAWTVIIDESYPPVEDHPALDVVRRTRAARTELDPIDTDGEGQADYSGDLLSDFDFAAFSHSALGRMADEVCMQMHLLNLSFVLAVGKRAGTNTELATSICTKQLIGLSAVAHEDGAWISLVSPSEVRPLQAIVTAIDPHLDVRVVCSEKDWTARVVETDTAAEEFPEVSIATVSAGTTFVFEPRRSLPLTVV
jgi:hypothetical protein